MVATGTAPAASLAPKLRVLATMNAIYGRWQILSKAVNGMVECRCLCGTIKMVRKSNIVSGKTKSCGCLAAEKSASRIRERSTIHGMSHSSEHKIWRGIIERCGNSDNTRYGGRGIKICARWLHSFENFYKDMGPRPSSKHSIDRINNDGDYDSSNCRWATASEQGNNRSNNRIVTWMGRSQTLTKWADEIGISRKTLSSRLLKLKWPLDQVMTCASVRCPRMFRGNAA